DRSDRPPGRIPSRLLRIGCEQRGDVACAGVKRAGVRFQELTVDLRRQPVDRWHLTPAQRQPARELLALYKTDLGLRRDLGGYLTRSLQKSTNVFWPDEWRAGYQTV